MPVRLPIAKLAASAVAPLTTTPQFSNALLQSGATWAQDVNYLRDTYMGIYSIWDRLKEPEEDQELYTETEPRLRELLLGLDDVSKQLTSRGDIYRDVQNASHDAEVAGSYGAAGDYGMASVYQSYSLMKLHRVLDSLTALANKKRAGRLLKMPDLSQPPSKEQKIRMKGLLDRGYNHAEAADLVGLEYTPMGELIRKGNEKLAYGYDVSGEVAEKGGTSGQSEHLWDTGQPQDHHETKPNPANVAMDFEAEDQFPELAKFKHKRVEFAPRNR